MSMSTMIASKRHSSFRIPYIPSAYRLMGLHEAYPCSITKKTHEKNNKEIKPIKISTVNDISLDKITKEEMEAINAIGPYIFKLNFSANHRLHGFGFTRVGQSITFSGFITIEVMFDDLNVSITLDKRLAKKIISDIVPVEKFSCLPKLLQLAIFEAALDDCIDGAEKALNVKVSIHNVSLDMKKESTNMFFSVVRSSNVRGYFSIATNKKVDERIMNALLENKQSLVNIEHSIGPILDRFLVPVRFELANIRLTQKEVTSLKVSDIVVIDQIKSKFNRGIKIFIGENYVAYGFWQQDRVKVTKKLEIEMGMLEQQKNHENHNDKEASTESLQIRLSFDAGSTNIDLKTLKKIRMGYTFKLDKNYKNLINIRSEGKCIAVGELVEIGSCIGVRIVEFTHGGD
jgi:flagellar motor switch/type III secretory pathway protein FliN